MYRDHESPARSREKSADMPAQREADGGPALVLPQRARGRGAGKRRRGHYEDRDRCGADLQLVHTATAALFALSGPRQFPAAGATVYFQEPKGTPFSVQVSAAIVPEQLAPIVCNTPVVAL